MGRTFLFVSLLALPVFSGCETKSASVAVVDLDEVAKQLQRDASIAADIQQAKTELESKLKEFQSQLQSQFDERSKSVAESTERPQELARIKQQLDLQLAQARQKAETHLAARRNKLVNDFRDEVKPVARRLAASRGSQLVVTKNDAVVFAFTPQADITTLVVEELRVRR